MRASRHERPPAISQCGAGSKVKSICNRALLEVDHQGPATRK